MGAVMLLSCPAKKVTKECGIGEALRLGAHLRAKSRALPGCAPKRACGRSRTRAALPYVPHPARTWHPLEHLNGQNLLHSA